MADFAIRGDASKATFAAALQKYHDARPACIDVPVEFPAALPKSGGSYNREEELLDELRSLGLVTATPEKVKAGGIRAFGGDPDKKVDGVRFSLTNEGQAALRPATATSLRMRGYSRQTGLCYGRYEVAEVSTFTTPADAMGQKISRVLYRYRIGDIASWAKGSEVLRSRFTGLKRDVAGMDREGKAVLISTSDGWVHQWFFSK